MEREDRINTARAVFAKAGFDVSSAITARNVCFSFVARRDRVLVVVKVLGNIDAFNRNSATEFKQVQNALGGSPLVIGVSTGSSALEDGIVYTRFKIPIITPNTLVDYLLEEVPPFIFAAPGGLYVKLNGEELRSIRDTQNLSLGTLAEIAGVSRRTIQLYETGMGAMIDAALRLEEYFNTTLVDPIDPFEYAKTDRIEEEHQTQKINDTDLPSLNHMITIGYSVTPIVKGPFDAISRDNKHEVVVLTGVDQKNVDLIEKAVTASEISSLTGHPAVIIVDKKPKKDHIKNTALISDDELHRIDDISVLNDMILSRSSRN